jgi:hypothetical protein
MIMVYIGRKELCDFECDSMEELKNTIVSHYSCENSYFGEITRLEDEDGKLINEDISCLNDELQELIDEAKKDLWENDRSDLSSDYQFNLI